MPAIAVELLKKEFTFSVRSPQKGLLGNFFTPDIKSVTAVDSISFSINKGETVAFIGPNGAGKSTTIKMLTGILHPTAGEIAVLGLSPQRERKQLALKIGSVFGQRSQLVFNLPLTDSFDLLAAVYQVPRDVYAKQSTKLIEAFQLAEFLDQPVRKLSLGQRMRAEVAASFIHNPEIVFLDEPTIGLDVVAKRSLRETLKDINGEFGTTIFLTSHDAGDIESVCKRTIVVNHGSIAYDGTTDDLSKKYLKKKVIRIIHDGESVPLENIPKDARVEKNMDGELLIEIDTESLNIARVLSGLMAGVTISDISIEDPPLEEVIGEL
ncbi:MAG: ATP-binding cassette domain-containing protein, partial [Patescibacteria group bacterium]